MPIVTDQAVCIRVWDWSETSQTVSLLCREIGLVRGVAKGAKRDASRFSGGFEVTSRGEVALSVKPGDQLSLLTEWDLQEVFPSVRASLSAFDHAMAMLDVTRSALQPLDPHPELFDTLLAGLRTLGDVRANQRGLLVVLWGVLDHTGHRPELFRDQSTGRALTDAAAFTFSPRLGGLLAQADRSESRGPMWGVRVETVACLRAVALGEGPGGASDDAVVRATRLLAHYYREVFGVEPPTLRRYVGEV